MGSPQRIQGAEKGYLIWESFWNAYETFNRVGGRGEVQVTKGAERSKKKNKKTEAAAAATYERSKRTIRGGSGGQTATNHSNTGRGRCS